MSRLHFAIGNAVTIALKMRKYSVTVTLCNRKYRVTIALKMRKYSVTVTLCNRKYRVTIALKIRKYSVTVTLCNSLVLIQEGMKEMFYLTTHSTHFIYDYMVSDLG